MRGLDRWIEGDPDAAFIEAEREHLADAPSLNDLIAEYEDWQQQNDLKLGSADEHLWDENLTQAQRQWLAEFCDRWEEAVRREQYDYARSR